MKATGPEMAHSAISSRFDVGVVIALREEFVQFFEVMSTTPETVEDGGYTYYSFRYAVGARNVVRGIVAFLPSMGSDEARVWTERLLNAFQPPVIVNLGIAGSLSRDCQLCDVVVADATDAYLYRGKITGKGEGLSLNDLQFGGKAFVPTPALVAQAYNLPDNHSRVFTQFMAMGGQDLSARVDEGNRSKLIAQGLLRRCPRIASGAIACDSLVVQSENFKAKLLSHNRNYLAVEMESAGVVQAALDHSTQPQVLVLKGISDFSDDRKEALDLIGQNALRAVAAGNAARLFRALLDVGVIGGQSDPGPQTQSGVRSSVGVRPDHEQMLSEIHQMALEHLPHHYADERHVLSCPFGTYAQLFSLFVKTPLCEKPADLFDQVGEQLLRTPVGKCLRTDGAAGTGKSAFLSLLYWYLFTQFQQGKNPLVPLYLDWHSLDLTVGRQQDIEAKSPAIYLKLHLKPITDLIESGKAKDIVLILDGYDGPEACSSPLSTALHSFCSDHDVRVVVGMREIEKTGNPLFQPQEFVSLVAVDEQDGAVEDVLKAYKAICMSRQGNFKFNRGDITDLYKLPRLDLFMLSLLEQSVSQGHRGRERLSDMLKSFCRQFLLIRLPDGAVDSALETAAALAFRCEVRADESPYRSGDPHAKVAQLLNSVHPLVSEFLAASYVVSTIRRIADTKTREADIEAKHLEYVYPYRINRLIRELVNTDSWRHTLDGIGKMLSRSGVPTYSKAHACYLAGRFAEDQAKDIARNLLNKFQKDWPRHKSDQTKKKDLLLERSLYISLSYLGDRKAQENYVHRLLSDPESDRFNRGFHLEYYGDNPFDPSAPLTSDDKLCPFPRTFAQLYKRVQRPGNPIFEIEIHTLCSLAQHRHAKGVLDEGFRHHLIPLLDTLLNEHRIGDSRLRAYVRMVRDHLRRFPFRIGDIFGDYYEIKCKKRQGWVARGITDGEAIGDHLYGCYLMALLLLPDSDASCGYNKSEILNMLLVHDLAEAITSDMLPEDRNEAAVDREQEVNAEIAMLGTYEGLGRTAWIGAVTEEFEAKQTENSRIAQDIDKLENLAQLLDYKLKGKFDGKEDLFESWKDSLRSTIKTSNGERILSILLTNYEAKQECADR